MNINKSDSQKRSGPGAPKASRSSETVSKEPVETSGAYDEDEVMSMMAGTDVFKATDKVRVFGANLDSKIASRGEGLQSYEEQWSTALMEETLGKFGGDMEAAKRHLRCVRE